VGDVTGKRVLVVGASKGIGRGVATRLHREGARVVVAARNLDLLQELGTACATACDVRDPESCRDAVETAASALGGLDALVYATGMGVIGTLAKAGRDDWVMAFETNVVGANLVTAAAVPYLAEANGVAMYFSSVSAQLTPPWMGMGVYLSCKKALEKSIEVWTLEEPSVRFTTIVAGSTSGGSFFPDATIVDPDDMPAFQADWQARGYLADEQLDPDDQADAVIHLMTSRAQVDAVWVRPRSIMHLPD
jgi:NAD(P)-dependent dehydrogenase (short-subunit alcohol dehydrogenase family)